jgi:quercetin dioxygenase-like cupin family protein
VRRSAHRSAFDPEEVTLAQVASRWNWPEELDALAAAPANHRPLLENERVRVLETVIAAGMRTAVHTHRWASVEYVLSGRDFVRRDGEGDILFDTRAASAPLRPFEVLWAEPFPPHSVENVGEVEMRVIMIEFKDPR